MEWRLVDEQTRHHLIKFLLDLPLEKVWLVQVERERSKRTNKQLKAYWGLAIEAIHQHTGIQTKDIHEELLCMRFGFEEYKVFGTMRKRPIKTTGDLSPQEMNEYYGWIQALAAQEFGLYIPDPNEPPIEAYERH